MDAHFAPNPQLCPAKQKKNLHAAYGGTLEIGRTDDGKLYLVGEMSFTKYLKGIAEVPRSWPPEALKAQIVAARTYAISHMNPQTEMAKKLRFNICSTDACQVFRGLNVENGAWGDVWSRSVDETAGQILEYSGKPASTFYFSTSNGQTYSNSDAFGGTPLPYLKPVTESDDTGSPLSHWTVKMPLSDVAEALQKAGTWKGGAIEKVVVNGADVELGNATGSIHLSLDELRRKLNSQAVCLTPKRYPTAGPDGKTYPETIPSKWMQLRKEGSDLLFEGRGWGHGVGMVQYGAVGKAQRGMTYADIMAFYYGGLRPIARPEPASIRVELATGLDSVKVATVGSVEVDGVAPGDVQSDSMTFKGGAAQSVEKSGPIEPVLRLENAMLEPAAVTATAVTSTSTPGAPSRTRTVSFDVSAPAKVAIAYSGPGGSAGVAAQQPVERGHQSVYFDPGALSLPAGSYTLKLSAEDGVDRVESEALTVDVEPTAAPSPSPRRAALPVQKKRPIWPIVIAILGLAGISAVIYARYRAASKSS